LVSHDVKEVIVDGIVGGCIKQAFLETVYKDRRLVGTASNCMVMGNWGADI
jgi:hypothetical protein